jgi:2,3-bisphosphoglycerate-dependent phosphoglycerate mutase
MITLVLLRHGESDWNKKNLFTGWVDVELSEKGEEEARNAGLLMVAAKLEFDAIYTSRLKRAQETLRLALEGMGRSQAGIPIIEAWQLNERHYGALQGLNKADVLAQYGEEQFKLWRRSYDVPPPPIEKGSKYDVSNDPLYADLPAGSVPMTESLKEVERRFMPYWNTEVVPKMKEGKRLLIVAHGNTFRALVKNLDGLTAGEVVEVTIPTGAPLVYTFDENMKVVEKRYL